MLGYKITLKCISIKQQARLAQSVARETLNLKVVGSSPTSGCVILLQKLHRLEWWLSRYRIFFSWWDRVGEVGDGALAAFPTHYGHCTDLV